MRNCWYRGLMMAGLLTITAATPTAVIGSEIITFDTLVRGLSFFNYDSNDEDLATDVIFSTADPFGFNSFGPGTQQRFIDEPGLEGTTALNPDLQVDFLQGAVGSVSFGFALISDGSATFTAFDSDDNVVGSATVNSAIFELPDGAGGGNGGAGEGGDVDVDNVFSSFPEGLVEVALSGTAVYGEFDFSVGGGEGGGDFGGRYIIDNFTFTPAGTDIISDFNGATPENPLLPGEVIIDDDGIPQFVFDFPVDENGIGVLFPIFIDPIVAVGYDYVVENGPNVTSILIPDPLPNGDLEFVLSIAGFADQVLQAGVAFDVTSLVAGGIDSFRISGIDTTELLDPADPNAFVTGLTFLNGATNVNVTQTAIVENTDVPEPAALALASFGFLALALQRRRRKLNA